MPSGEGSTSHQLSVSNLTSLNHALCSRYNRQGFMCGECVEGHVPAVYSYTVDCVQCLEYRYNWLKYLAVAYLPLTVLYFIVLALSISVTSGRMVAYVALCQIVTTPAVVQFYSVNNVNNPDFPYTLTFLTQPHTHHRSVMDLHNKVSQEDEHQRVQPHYIV